MIPILVIYVLVTLGWFHEMLAWDLAFHWALLVAALWPVVVVALCVFCLAAKLWRLLCNE